MLNLSLKNRLLAVSISGILLVALAFWVGEKAMDNDRVAQIETLNVAYSGALWQAIADGYAGHLAAESKALTRNRDIGKALKTGDRKALAEAAKPTFVRTSAGGYVDGLLVADLEGTVLYNSSDGAGGAGLSRLLRGVAERGKVANDLVVGPGGQASLIHAFPLYVRGKARGVGGYLVKLERVAGDLAGSVHGMTLLAKPAEGARFSSAPEVTADIALDGLDLGTPGWTSLDAAGRHYSTAIVPLRDAAGEHLQTLVVLKDETAMIDHMDTVTFVQLAVALVVLVIVIVTIAWQISSAFKPLAKAVASMEAIAAGDLTREITCDSRNEIADMLKGMQLMQMNLRQIVDAIHGATDQLNAVAGEAAAIAVQASGGANRQKADTDNVATAITEMSATVQAVAEHADQAASAATEADQQARHGQTVVDETIATIQALAEEVRSGADAIGRVRQESDAIGQILDVIRGIAEQTNLLALNAAIEAARAGEQGRGFAVVADEVRTLASRTQDSTSEIQAMIERLQDGTQDAVNVMDHSQQRADSSVSQITTAGEALRTIAEAITQISTMNTQIATAAGQQRVVSDEISRNVISISGVAEETVLGSARANDANGRVANLAAELKEQVDRFKL